MPVPGPRVLTARERNLFTASARKIYECLSHTATVNGLIRAMEFGVCLPQHGRLCSSRNEPVGGACLANRSICCLHGEFRISSQDKTKGCQKSVTGLPVCSRCISVFSTYSLRKTPSTDKLAGNTRRRRGNVKCCTDLLKHGYPLLVEVEAVAIYWHWATGNFLPEKITVALPT